MAKTLRLSDETEKNIEAICIIDGVTQNAFIEKAIQEAIIRRMQEPDFMDKWRAFAQPILDLIHQLGIK